MQAALGATVSVDPGNGVTFTWRKELRENKENSFFLSFFRLCKATSFWADAHERYSTDQTAASEETFMEETFANSEMCGRDFLTDLEYKKIFK
jgi:hypothetical protein